MRRDGTSWEKQEHEPLEDPQQSEENELRDGEEGEEEEGRE